MNEDQPGTIMNTYIFVLYLKILGDLNIYLKNSRDGQDIPPPPRWPPMRSYYNKP